MVPFNLNLGPMRQEAVRRGRTVQQLTAPLPSQNPFRGTLPVGPISPMSMIPVAQAGASDAMNSFLSRPDAPARIQNAKGKQAEDEANAFANRNTPPAISNEQALWTIGIGTLLRLLGASHEDVMGGANAFLGGQQAAWQREREKENQQFQLQQAKIEREARFAENIARIRGEQQQQRENRRLKGLDLIASATRAKNPAEAEAIFRAARELGAVPDQSTVRGTMQEIGEARKMARLEMEAERLRQQSLQQERLDREFRLGPMKMFENLIKERGPSLSPSVMKAIQNDYNALKARAERIGYEGLPSLETFLIPTMDAANFNQREREIAQKALEFQSRNELERAKFEWDKLNKTRDYNLKVQERMDKQAQGLAVGDLMKVEQEAAISLFNTEFKEFREVQAKVKPVGDKFDRVSGGLIDSQVGDFGREFRLRSQRMIEMYHEFVRLYGAKSKPARDAYGSLMAVPLLRGQVSPPEEVERRIARPLGPVGAGQALQGGGSGQPPVPFRNR